MRATRTRAVVAAVALVGGLGTTFIPSAAAGAAPNARTVLAGSHSSASDHSAVVAHVAPNTAESVQVELNPRDNSAATALAEAVSTPGNALFHHYLTVRQWEARFSPAASEVSAVQSWLRSEGLTLGAVSADRLSVSASGSAAHMERAFGVALNVYRVQGKDVQLAASDYSVPASLASAVQGVVGLDETFATADTTIPPPAGFRNPPICTTAYGTKDQKGVPAYGDGYPTSLPLTPCGYTPKQLQSAYGMGAAFAKGDTGKGYTIGIIDAYASTTLLADAQEYFQRNDPSWPLNSSQFTETTFTPYTHVSVCGSWNAEQSLDVEASHTMAPGADIHFFGAASCYDSALLAAERSAVDSGSVNVISNSWGDIGGDLLDSSSTRDAYDTLFRMAATTGVTIQFSSGDWGDDYTTVGVTAPVYPASSPWVTGVGGTTTAIGSNGKVEFAAGWSTSRSLLCTSNLVKLGACTKSEYGTYVPPAPGAFDYGSGGGTSYEYAEPYYQTPVVPSSYAHQNSGVTGIANRVVPDISMDADPSTGMLIGLTQSFPSGVAYGQYRIGGTSLASPLLAGAIAVSDQAAGVPLGFLNPIIYKADASGSARGFYDVTPQGPLAMFRWDYANEISKADGYVESVRTIDYQGPETYCNGNGDCGTQDVALSVAKGYDNMTGLGTAAPGFVAALSKY